MMLFPRQIGLKRAICRSLEEYDTYVRRMNGRTCLYTSLYSFDVERDYDSAVMDRAWWDFDMNDDYTMEDVKHDVAALIMRLEGDVRLVATGRGFHIHQMFKRPVRGRDWSQHLDRYERKMADGLSSLDGVGYPEKMTRISGTFNVKRGRWAVAIPAQDFAQDPFGFPIPDKPLPDSDKIDPFKGRFTENDCFDLVKWVHDNPAPKRSTNRNESTVSVGVLGGECALPNCLERAIQVSNPPHHVRVALVQEMRRQLAFYAHPKDLTEDENAEIADGICNFIEGLGWTDFNAGITRKYVVGAVRKYAHAPSPRWYQKHNLCNGEGCWFCSQ